MKSSSKVEVSPNNSASGKKLIQARLPFKTLSGGPSVTATIETVPSENRKRKLTATDDDGLRAAKLNRKSVVKDVVDEDVPTIDLLATESMEASCDLNMHKVNKENIIEENDGGDIVKENDQRNKTEAEQDIIEIDVQTLSDDPELLNSPKAKKCLDMGDGEAIVQRKSKRIKEEKIMIKLPMTSKAKQSAKKMKKTEKGKKTPAKNESKSNDEEDEELEENVDTDNDTSVIEKRSPASSESGINGDGKEDTSLLDISMVSNVDSPARDSLNETTASVYMTPTHVKLTPKQLLKRAESEKKSLEKQRAKEERERKIQEEKEMRQREKEEKERQRKKERDEKEELRRKEREEKEDQKRREKEEREKKKQAELDEKEEQRKKEREEKERKRQAEIDAKNEDRKRKEEQKEEERRKREEQKEEERRKKEEEKRQKDEAEQMKMKKTAQAFAKFFVPKKSDNTKPDNEQGEKVDEERTTLFVSFQVKENMKLAPITRRTLESVERKNLESNLLTDKPLKQLYLMELKNGKHDALKCGKTWVVADEDQARDDEDEIQVLDEFGTVEIIAPKSTKQNHKAKLLKFHENRRPAYYGTWRKKSKTLGPRRPFAQDKTYFDYEIDSDDEWEEEEPGESLHGSEDEKDQESDDDYDIDNEFFVPHGHLSDEEIMQEDEMEDNSPEAQKAKMKMAQKEFDDELKKKTEKLKPRLIGLIWQNPDGSKPDNCSNGIWDFLNVRSCMYTPESVVLRTDGIDSGNEDTENKGPRRTKITEDFVPDLVRLVNGNRNNCNFLIKEFRAYVAKKCKKENRKEFSNISIKNKIKELAEWKVCPEPGVLLNKMCWYISPEKREVHGLRDLSLPNTWSYILKPKIDETEKEKEKEIDLTEETDSKGAITSETITSASVKQASSKQSAFNIAKFIRVLSEDEKKKQFGSLTLRTASPTNIPGTVAAIKTTKKSPSTRRGASAQKKRVNLLMSVPRGEEIPPKLKNTLVTQFLNTAAKRKKSSTDDGQTAGSSRGSHMNAVDNDDVIVLD